MCSMAEEETVQKGAAIVVLQPESFLEVTPCGSMSRALEMNGNKVFSTH